MSKDYIQTAQDVVTGAKALREAAPDTMAAFAALGAAAYTDGALSKKTKELVALAIGVAVRCDGCVAWHAKMAHKLGATREEVVELLAVAIQMGGGPSSIYAGQALQAYDAFAAQK
ncbi:MAG: carboxymuconolactone decarboxylase family protein [Neomegalonema sp.]|nr:carboxymuconolactone decarboxylase family protein [Neomegalonema sp.]